MWDLNWNFILFRWTSGWKGLIKVMDLISNAGQVKYNYRHTNPCYIIEIKILPATGYFWFPLNSMQDLCCFEFMYKVYDHCFMIYIYVRRINYSWTIYDPKIVILYFMELTLVCSLALLVKSGNILVASFPWREPRLFIATALQCKCRGGEVWYNKFVFFHWSALLLAVHACSYASFLHRNLYIC